MVNETLFPFTVALLAIAAFTKPIGVAQSMSIRSGAASGLGAAIGAAPAGALGGGTGWFHA